MNSPHMDDENNDSTGNDSRPTFYIGHHDSKRTDVSPQLLQQSQDCGYAMLTVPITTPYFNLRVLNLLVEYFANLSRPGSGAFAIPVVPSLSALDTNLAPGETVPQLLGVVSPWIDLSSPDPVVYNISRQVLEIEVAYAAFCGIGNLILPSPKIHYGKTEGVGIAQYAHAIQRALEIGSFIQISVMMPMMDNPHDVVEETKGSVSLQARPEFAASVPESDWQSPYDANGSLDCNPQELLDVKPRKSVQVSSKHDYFGTWDAWNVIRTICRYNSRLFVALMIPRYLPPASVCSRWHSEPLRMLTIHARTFFDNRGGYPVLHKEHRGIINTYMRLRNPPWLVLFDVVPIPGVDDPEAVFPSANGELSQSTFMETADPKAFPTPSEASTTKHAKPFDPLHHLNILRRLQQEQVPQTALERIGAGYQDYLQAPLQPLTDNLESITYEVFEKDPVKYDLYLQAIERALMDWRQQKKPTSGPAGKVVVAVVGAGRGPLVTRALQASKNTGVPIDIWALEKNPNAFVLLERHNISVWNNQVHLVRSDMRAWKGPSNTSLPPRQHQANGTTASFVPRHYAIDVLISELLGSFADNELSPECLDGILPLLNPTYGISIPRSYTAFLTPIAAPKLHADILSRIPTDKEASNTPYVVMLHAVDYLSTTASPNGASPSSPGASSGPAIATATSTSPTNTTATSTFPPPHILPAWSFHHSPTQSTPPLQNTHNTRQARLSFPLKDRAVCHGLAGYFEAVLYPGVELSTHPHTMERKSEGMMSWFPIFFPLKNPLYTPDNSHLTVSMYRNTDARKVWYEWMLESWVDLPSPGSGGSSVAHESSTTAVEFHQRGGGGGEGKRVRLGMSEVGSSRERGCMM